MGWGGDWMWLWMWSHCSHHCPRCLGPGGGEKKQDASIKSVGFPAPKPRAVWSGLVCSLAVIMWVRQDPGAPDSM